MYLATLLLSLLARENKENREEFYPLLSKKTTKVASLEQKQERRIFIVLIVFKGNGY